jgi:ABC-type uncharacterized transport system permease subunit
LLSGVRQENDGVMDATLLYPIPAIFHAKLEFIFNDRVVKIHLNNIYCESEGN